MHKSLTHSTLSGLIWLITGAGFQAVLLLAVFIIFARLLTPADFGVVNAASIIVGFSEIFSLLGVGPAIVQRPNLEERHLRTGFTVSVFFGVLMAGIIGLLSPFFANFFKMEELTFIIRALVLVFPIHSLSVIAESLLQREFQFRCLAIINITSFTIGYGIVGISLAFAGFGKLALIGATVSKAVCNSAILLTMKPHPKRPQFNYNAFKELIHFGSGFTIARIFTYIASQGDYLIVGRWLGAEALGIYGRAYQLMVLPANLLGHALDRVLFSAMAKVQEEPRRLATAYRRGITLTALLILPASAVLFVLSPEIINLLLGPAWAGVNTPFQILILGMLFRTSDKISDSLLRAKGKVYKRAWIQAVYAAFILIGAWLGHHWGISGVASGVIVALGINFILMTQFSLHLASISWKEFLNAHIPATVFTVVIFVNTFLVTIIMRSLSMSTTVTIITSIVTIFIIISLLFHFIPQFIWGIDGIWLKNSGSNIYKKLLKKYRVY